MKEIPRRNRLAAAFRISDETRPVGGGASARAKGWRTAVNPSTS
jgi:hypothetical protein